MPLRMQLSFGHFCPKNKVLRHYFFPICKCHFQIWNKGMMKYVMYDTVGYFDSKRSKKVAKLDTQKCNFIIWIDPTINKIPPLSFQKSKSDNIFSHFWFEMTYCAFLERRLV